MIKKTTLLIALICLIFNSCSTDIEINTPGLQATIDGKLFRPDIKKAIIHDNGTLVIKGNTGTESISFATASTNIGTYKIGQLDVNEASFQDEDIKFTSKEEVSDGQIVITEIYNNQISGHFYFDNLEGTNGRTMSFKNGWFYRIPIENYVPEEEPEVIEEEPEEEDDDEQSEEEEEEINPCLLNATLTAKIDGAEMITDDHDATTFGIDYSSILITASNEDDEITIVFPVEVMPGDYSLTGSGDYSATYSYKNDKSSALNGQLTITSHDADTKCISGSYEFTTRSGVSVTEGIFDFGY